MTPSLSPALLDRARRAWPSNCMSSWGAEHYSPGPNNTCRGDYPCDLHAAIAGALEKEYERGQTEKQALYEGLLAFYMEKSVKP